MEEANNATKVEGRDSEAAGSTTEKTPHVPVLELKPTLISTFVHQYSHRLLPNIFRS